MIQRPQRKTKFHISRRWGQEVTVGDSTITVEQDGHGGVRLIIQAPADSEITWPEMPPKRFKIVPKRDAVRQ